jgi:hypothetical protein
MLPNLEFLTSAKGQQLLERLAGENLADAHTLRLLTVLRKDHTAEQAGSALEMARLRVKAVSKFDDDAHQMFFTRDALEQASDPLVRAYRARDLIPPNHEGIYSLIDAGCGIGADSLAFASTGADVLGLDIDPVRVEIARYNAGRLGLKARFEVADIRDGLPDANEVFFDPARRDDQGKRIYDVERYLPPLSIIQSWEHDMIQVKLSPGVDLDQLKSYGGAVEFISVDGDLKEAVLTCGRDFPGYGLFATLLVSDQVYQWNNPGEYTALDRNISIAEPRGWLVEPDPAILRAGLVQDVAEKFSGLMLDETIAYFTTDVKPESPWVRAWQILDWMPFNLKKLRAYLRERNVGNVTVKKRGSPLTPEELIPQLKLKGSESRTLVLTRLRGQPIVIICVDISG